MRATLVLILLLLTVPAANAGEFPNCKYTYFKSKQIATSTCYDTNNRWGRARAFDRTGKIIYDRELRKVAGHSSVQFSFYESGAVKKAYWSSAPDAGIQWYRATTLFSEDGKVTSETEDNYDKGPGTVMPRKPGHIAPPAPHMPTPPKVTPTKPAPSTTMECAVIYASEFWFTNTTPYTVVVTTNRKANLNETYTTTLRPRQTLKGGQMIGAQIFYDPSLFYDFHVKPLKQSRAQEFIIRPSARKPETPKTEVRRYYYEIRRII